MSKSCCHLCGCGHTRLFFWTSANTSSRVVMFRWYESAMKGAHRPVVAHGLSSCHYAYGMATKNFRSWPIAPIPNLIAVPQRLAFPSAGRCVLSLPAAAAPGSAGRRWRGCRTRRPFRRR
jgi:hypothetical protein